MSLLQISRTFQEPKDGSDNHRFPKESVSYPCPLLEICEKQGHPWVNWKNSVARLSLIKHIILCLGAIPMLLNGQRWGMLKSVITHYECIESMGPGNNSTILYNYYLSPRPSCCQLLCLLLEGRENQGHWLAEIHVLQAVTSLPLVRWPKGRPLIGS